MRTATTWAVAIVRAGLVAGCGADENVAGGNDEAKIRQVIGDLGTAARAGNGETICNDLVTENLRYAVPACRRAAAGAIRSS